MSGPEPVRMYGLKFPAGTSRVSIELHCYKVRHVSPAHPCTPAKHIANAIKLLWPEKMPDGQTGYIWTEWSDERFESLCEITSPDGRKQTIVAWWGPSAVAKSTDAAVFFLADWFAAPDITSTFLCSTALGDLEHRIFGEVIRFHGMLGDRAIGTYNRTKVAIQFNPTTHPKAGIFGIPVLSGTPEKTKGRIVGKHSPRTRLCIDEAQGTRTAIYEASANIRACADYIQLSMGNPDGWLNPLGVHSEPVNGRNSVHPDRDHRWKTKEGVCIFWDGRKSPGILNPTRYPFLLNQMMLDETERLHGKNSAVYYRERIGFVMPAGLSRAIIPEATILDGHAMDQATWARDPVIVSACDPAYSATGDRCIFVSGKFGILTTGEQVVCFMPWEHIQIDAEKISQLRGGKLEYLATEIVKMMRRVGVQPSHHGQDTTGMQSLLADEIDRMVGGTIHRIGASSRPTDNPVSDKDSRPRKDVYEDRITEVWMQGARYFVCECVRGISREAAVELSQRETKQGTVKIQVESKDDLRKRLQSTDSPDIADAHLMLLDVVSNVIGFNPQPGGFAPRPVATWTPEMGERAPDMANADIDSDPDNYLTFEL